MWCVRLHCIASAGIEHGDDDDAVERHFTIYRQLCTSVRILVLIIGVSEYTHMRDVRLASSQRTRCVCVHQHVV